VSDISVVDGLAQFILHFVQGRERCSKEIRLVFVRTTAEPFGDVASGGARRVSQLIAQI
jgi:hypothetical protein